MVMRKKKEQTPFGYVYEIINKTNGKTYVGKRTLRLDKNWRQYIGSGVVIQQAIKKYGEENFVKRLVTYCYSENDLIVTEEDEINKAWKNRRGQYNLSANGFSGGDTITDLPAKTREEIRKRQSEGIKNSHKVKLYRKREKEERIQLRKRHEKEVLTTFKELKSVKDTHKELGLSRRLVREILDDNSIQPILRNRPHNMRKTPVRLKIALANFKNTEYPDGLNGIEKHDQLLKEENINFILQSKKSAISAKHFKIGKTAMLRFIRRHGLNNYDGVDKTPCYICKSRGIDPFSYSPRATANSS